MEQKTQKPGVSPAETPTQGRRFTRGTRWIVVLVSLMAVGYLGLAFYVQDKVASGTTVLGVDIGGLTAVAAEEKLTAEMPASVADPIAVSAQERTSSLNPADAGLRVDVPATIDSVTGFSLNPLRVLPHLFGAGAVDAAVDVDPNLLAEALAVIGPDLETPPVDGTIDVSSGEAVIGEPMEGIAIDRDAAAQTLVAHWPEGEQPIELDMVVARPAVDEAELDRAMRQIVNPLLSGPVTLTVEGAVHTVDVAMLAVTASILPNDAGELDLTIDGAPIAEQIRAASPDMGEPGVEASFAFVDGAPVIMPSQTGLGLNPDEVGAAVRKAALGVTRLASVALSEMHPEFSTEAAEALGIKEIIAEFSTPLTADSVRTSNLIRGTALVNGTLLKPGETYSLLGVLRPISTANGFVESGVVENGVSAKAIGGGLSQMSTTLYNGAYFAGMEMVEYRPHSRWFERYPEGRESTLWDGELDLRFTNKTPYGVLFQSWVSEGRVWVRAWSTTYFEVESITSPRRNFTNPGTIYNPDPKCIAEPPGKQGFTVDVTRVRYLDGVEFDRSTNTWTYRPWNEVICGEKPDPNAPSTPPGEPVTWE